MSVALGFWFGNYPAHDGAGVRGSGLIRVAVSGEGCRPNWLSGGRHPAGTPFWLSLQTLEAGEEMQRHQIPLDPPPSLAYGRQCRGQVLVLDRRVRELELTSFLLTCKMGIFQPALLLIDCGSVDKKGVCPT